mmetsp:Transcript_26248/g.74168  ORF Transcript_26248/g.74168 Transcript_26248/m.74168 type:complete len:227 (-) Transcript_26248:104-784(-)
MGAGPWLKLGHLVLWRRSAPFPERPSACSVLGLTVLTCRWWRLRCSWRSRSAPRLSSTESAVWMPSGPRRREAPDEGVAAVVADIVPPAVLAAGSSGGGIAKLVKLWLSLSSTPELGLLSRPITGSGVKLLRVRMSEGAGDAPRKCPCDGEINGPMLSWARLGERPDAVGLSTGVGVKLPWRDVGRPPLKLSGTGLEAGVVADGTEGALPTLPTMPGWSMVAATSR